MAYSKGVITIPKVTGNVVITVTTQAQPSQNLINLNRTNTTRGSSSISLYSSSYSQFWDESKMYNDVLMKSGVPNGYACGVANLSETSITVTEDGYGGFGVSYPLEIEGGKSYKLTYDYSGSGKGRTYYAFNADGTVTQGTAMQNDSTAGLSGSAEYTITAPAGTTVWLFLGFSSNTSATKAYTNVSLTEVA